MCQVQDASWSGVRGLVDTIKHNTIALVLIAIGLVLLTLAPWIAR